MATETLMPVRRSDIRVGDTVIATKGATVIRGVVRDAPTGGYADGPFIAIDGLPQRDVTFALRNLEHRSYTFQRVEPPLPAADGLYRDKDGDIWVVHRGTRQMLDNLTSERLSPAYAPYTRIDTVPKGF